MNLNKVAIRRLADGNLIVKDGILTALFLMPIIFMLLFVGIVTNFIDYGRTIISVAPVSLTNQD